MVAANAIFFPWGSAPPNPLAWFEGPLRNGGKGGKGKKGREKMKERKERGGRDGYTDYRARHLSRKQQLERVSCQFPTWMFYVYVDVYFNWILHYSFTWHFTLCANARFRNIMFVRFHTIIFCAFECQKNVRFALSSTKLANRNDIHQRLALLYRCCDSGAAY